MHDRDDQTGSAVGDQRCGAQTRSHVPLTTGKAQPATGRKSLPLRYERVKPSGSIICKDLFAKCLILNMAQMGGGSWRAIATGGSRRSRPSHEKQVPPLGSGWQKESANSAKSERRRAKSGFYVS